MKTRFLSACLLCLSAGVSAQTYRTFPLGDASWLEGHTVWFSVHVIEYRQQGDTLVPGYALSKKLHIRRVYSKNWANPMLDTVYSEQPMLIGALSQDTANRRVYYTAYKYEDQYPPGIPYDFHPKPDTTLLLYDFDLGLLEKVGWAPEPRWFLESKPVQLKDGSWSRSLRFLNESFDLDTTYFWIEGVGGVYGLFTPLIDTRLPDASSSLGCFSANGNLLYPTHIETCTGITTLAGTTPEHAANVRLFPNPATNRFFAEVPSHWLPAVLIVHDAQGNRLLTQELVASFTEISLNDWPNNAPLFVQTIGKNSQQNGTVLFVVR